jgi:hypothetical protein
MIVRLDRRFAFRKLRSNAGFWIAALSGRGSLEIAV